MVETLTRFRTARAGDAPGVARAHDSAWREAYRGIIPGGELERMIARRGPRWWERAIAGGSPLLVFDFGGEIGGYCSFGRNRVPALPYEGEVFELYLAPEYQGIGFGRRLFAAARRELAAHGLRSTVVWALADNPRATGFYESLGGLRLRRAGETFGPERLERIAYGFD